MKTISLIAATALVLVLALYTLAPKSTEYSTTGSTANSTKMQNDIEKIIPTLSKSTNEMPATAHLDSIVLGAGCFWGG